LNSFMLKHVQAGK